MNNSLGQESGLTRGSSKRHSSRFRELRVDALSTELWNYLLGLFLTDGCSRLKRSKKSGSVAYLVEFYFSGNEEPLARNIVGLLSRVGLNFRLRKRSSKENMLILSVCSRNLFEFLPLKKTLRDSLTMREKFYKENKLFNVEFGVPFVAGLLDGDGCCQLRVRPKTLVK